MFDTNVDDDLFSASDALEAIADLEKNTSDSIVAQRASERLDIRTKIVVRPANASERHGDAIDCVTADVSNGGCMVLSPRPILPGDLFWLSFDASELNIGSLFGRCLRCRFVREEIYEAGFRFLQDIDLADAVPKATNASA